jgi:hypothetical protein
MEWNDLATRLPRLDRGGECTGADPLVLSVDGIGGGDCAELTEVSGLGDRSLYG